MNQQYILIGVTELKKRLTDAIAKEKRRYEKASAYYEIVIQRRQTEIKRREREMENVYFPLLVALAEKWRHETNPIHFFPVSKIAATNRHGFKIELPAGLFSEIESPQNSWREHFRLIAEHATVGAGVVAYTVRVDDLFRPKCPSATRLNRLNRQLEALDKVNPNDDDVLITIDFGKFLFGADYKYWAHYEYDLLPE